MTDLKLPVLPKGEKMIVAFYDGAFGQEISVIAQSKNKKFIKLYHWDKISKNYNYLDERLKFKQKGIDYDLSQVQN